MKSGSEQDVRQGIQKLLDNLAPGRFRCVERKSSGESVIGKPVDLEIRSIGTTPRAVLAVEVANVNTTQLVGEICRLYYDSCPLKILVLGDRNVPRNGVDICKRLLARLYGQEKIEHTPARVVNYDDDDNLRQVLKELLLL
jgi:hypothetical protein